MTDDDAKTLASELRAISLKIPMRDGECREIDSLNRAADLIEQLTLRWSSGRPTAAGVYWVEDPKGAVYTFHLWEFNFPLDHDAWTGYRFAGPIPTPLECDAATKEAAR